MKHTTLRSELIALTALSWFAFIVPYAYVMYVLCTILALIVVFVLRGGGVHAIGHVP